MLVSLAAPASAAGTEEGTMKAWEQRDTLPEAKQGAFAAAQESLDEAIPAGYECLEFAYLEGKEEGKVYELCTVELELSKGGEIIAYQFVDGEWVRKEVVIEGSEICVKDAVDAPTAFCVVLAGSGLTENVSVASPKAAQYHAHDGSSDCRIVLWQLRDTLTVEKSKVYEAAKACLKDAVPEGLSCRDLVYHEHRDDCESCDVELVMDEAAKRAGKKLDAEWSSKTEGGICAVYDVNLPMVGAGSEIAVKQFVGGEWVSCSVVVDDIGIIILGVAEGPLAIFM